jgi:hypothetical protein
MEISGHGSRSVFDRYSMVGGKDIRDAAEKMQERLTARLGSILQTGTLLSTPDDSDGGPEHAKAWAQTLNH